MMRLALFVCFLTTGVFHAWSYECDIAHVQKCKEYLIDIEGYHFPFYGGNDEELDETCKSLNGTFECIHDFISNCAESPDCDDSCQGEVTALSSLMEHTGVTLLHDKLCEPGQPFRKSYLDSYPCLQKAAAEYSYCYNKSLDSREYVATLVDHPEEHLEQTCCFFSWYEGCFVNATMETCGPNDTFVVSFALHMLTGSTVQQLCLTGARCSDAPLPSDYVSTEPELSTKPGDENAGSAAPCLFGHGTNLCIYATIALISNVIARVCF